MVVRLTKKLAERLDDVDLAAFNVGDAVALPFRAAMLLIAEGWAELVERRQRPRPHHSFLRHTSI
jgi:hypothetical protein